MDRVFESGASATPPSPPPSPSQGFPAAGNPGLSIAATKPGKYWYYMITEELRKVITDAGLTPDHTNVTQLKAALDALYAPKGGASAAIAGAFRNLIITASGTAAALTVTCDELILGDGAGNYVVERSISGTITTTVTGAGGLDAGTLAASTWYHLWRIGKTDGTRAYLFSLSPTAPTMPTGYTLKAYLGPFYTDATNKYPVSCKITGRTFEYVTAAGSNLTVPRQMASGSAGSISTPTLVGVATSAFVPANASKIKVLAAAGNGNGTGVIVAPNGNYGAFTSTTNPAPIFIYGTTSTLGQNVVADLNLESTSIYWASSGASNGLFCLGFEVNF